MNGPVLVNSETPTASDSVVINTTVVPDFSDVKETSEQVSTDVKPVPSTNDNLVSLLTDLRTDFLSVVKLVEALNKNVTSNSDKVKQLEQTLSRLVEAKLDQSVVPSVSPVQPVRPVQPVQTARPVQAARPVQTPQPEQKTKHAQQKTDKKKRSVFSQF